jgi:hypothetical protein
LFSFQETVTEGSTSSMVLGILAPTCVITSALGLGFGFGPIPYSLSSEIMPQKVKGVCCSLCLATRQLNLPNTLFTVFLASWSFKLHNSNDKKNRKLFNTSSVKMIYFIK